MRINKKSWLSFGLLILVLIIFAIFLNEKFFNSKNASNVKKSDQKNTHTVENLPQDSKKFLYKSEAGLVLYSPTERTKILVLGSDVIKNILDWDISRDGSVVAFTLKESGFEGDSAVYVKNLKTGNTIKISKNENVSQHDVKVLPDGKRVVYVQRDYDQGKNILSDGAIWIADISNNQQQKIIGDDGFAIFQQAKNEKDAEGNACVSEDELGSAKIGINKISFNGQFISYWKSSLSADCDGYNEESFFAKMDGSEVFTKDFLAQNTYLDSDGQKKNWNIDDVYWLDDGSFVLSNTNTEGASAVYYFDNSLNKKWTIYDSYDLKFASSGLFSQFTLDDIRLENGKLSLAYEIYYDDADDNYYQDGKFAGSKFFVLQLNVGQELSSQKLVQASEYASVEQDSNESLSSVKLVGDNTVYYEKINDQTEEAQAYVYDLTSQTETYLN